MRNSLFFLSLITLFFQSPLHGSNDVTELVEDTAPAVVILPPKERYLWEQIIISEEFQKNLKGFWDTKRL